MDEFMLLPEEMRIDPRLVGSRCVGQIRCSRKDQSVRSLPQQQAWLREFAAANSMVYVEDMKEAISASQTKKRPDLDRIYQRKSVINDFSVVVVQDLSRLTRGGAKHGLELYFKFKTLGIRLVSLVDGLIEGDEQIVKAARRFQEARAAVKLASLNMRRGAMAAKKKGRNGYAYTPPFAVDRLIVSLSREPLFRLRAMRDGSQQKLSPDGQTLLHTYPPNEVGQRRHHIKQADEFEDYTPGHPSDVKVVNRIFREYDLELKKYWIIARSLNDDGIPSPRGRRWHVTSVKSILRNSLYVNRQSQIKQPLASFT
ncbi:MAG TPA: recombinase family protein [Tepidisphaeraceae bacterium]|nr:recombinase family protein [Tepidisphaeraceae bacterium]